MRRFSGMSSERKRVSRAAVSGVMAREMKSKRRMRSGSVRRVRWVRTIESLRSGRRTASE